MSEFELLFSKGKLLKTAKSNKIDILVNNFITEIMKYIVGDFSTKDFKFIGEYIYYGSYLKHMFLFDESELDFEFEINNFIEFVIEKYVDYLLLPKYTVIEVGCPEKETFFQNIKNLHKPMISNGMPNGLKGGKPTTAKEKKNLIETKATQQGLAKRVKQSSEKTASTIHDMKERLLNKQLTTPDKQENTKQKVKWVDLITMKFYLPLEASPIVKRLIDLYISGFQNKDDDLITDVNSTKPAPPKSTSVENLLKLNTGCKYKKPCKANLNIGTNKQFNDSKKGNIDENDLRRARRGTVSLTTLGSPPETHTSQSSDILSLNQTKHKY
jgi:hypothetical protein